MLPSVGSVTVVTASQSWMPQGLISETLVVMLSRVLTKRPFPLQDGTALQVFVAEVANQIVGIAVIRKEMVS